MQGEDAVDPAILLEPLPGEARRLEILKEADVFSPDNHTAFDRIMSLACRALKVNCAFCRYSELNVIRFLFSFSYP